MFVNVPLRIHPFAQKAAEAGECGARQGRFVEMQDLLFQEPQGLSTPEIRIKAETARLDVVAFDRCLTAEGAERVRTDLHLGSGLGVTSTPTFIVGFWDGHARVTPLQMIDGARPILEFRHALDQTLAQLPR